MADDGLPVRRVDEEHVRLLGEEMLARALVAPAQHFPPAFRFRLVAPVVLAINDVRGMRREQSADDFTRCLTSGALRLRSHSFTHMFFASVKNSSDSKPPSRPTPLSRMPPNGTRRSRRSQQLIQTVPLSMAAATRCARLRSRVHKDAERP